METIKARKESVLLVKENDFKEKNLHESNPKSEENGQDFSYIGFGLIILFLYFSMEFLSQWWERGFSKIEKGLIFVPVIWILFAISAIIAEQEYLQSKGFGFLPKVIKFIFFALMALFFISIISQCSGFGGGGGLPDNVRL